jgi:hypothetical protein
MIKGRKSQFGLGRKWMTSKGELSSLYLIGHSGMNSKQTKAGF